MSTIIQSARELLIPAPSRIPTSVKERLNRGRMEMLKDASKRRLCVRFERGETYWYLDQRLRLQLQSTVTTVGGKPPYRIRNQYNYIRPIVEGKVSAATARVPSYEVISTSTDPEKIGAARLGEKIANYGYYQWNIRKVSVDVTKLAISAGGEGFAMPYFDPDVGPYIQVQDPMTGEMQTVGRGEIKIATFNGNEVYWEPGVKFEDSAWWATEQAVPVDKVIEYPGYFGGKLVPDASSSDIPNDKTRSNNLVMVVEYFERPSMRNPRGRKFRISNGRLVCPQEDYPLMDQTGAVLDEPIIHRLVYTHDPFGSRDLGLVWQLIDFQRTAQDCFNKLLEYKNRGMNPRIMAPVGSLLARPTDEPGGIDWYRPIGGQVPAYEQPIKVPPELFNILNIAKGDMRDVSSDSDFTADPNVAAQTVQQVLAVDQARWASFIADSAEWHSRLMHHCLLLVARFYTEPRLLSIRGRFGPDPIKDFRGMDLLDQQDVIVQPSSLQMRTKQDIQTQIFAFADRGWITPEAAMAAIDDAQGSEKLVQSYELDVSRINRIIQKIRDGSVLEMPPRQQEDPITGEPVIDPRTGQVLDIPGWMPDEQDNAVVWISQLSDWMKTEEYEQMAPQFQEIARHMLKGMKALEVQKAMEAQMAQTAQAQKLGMGNAALPARQAPMPSMRSPQSGGNPGQNPGQTGKS